MSHLDEVLFVLAGICVLIPAVVALVCQGYARRGLAISLILAIGFTMMGMIVMGNNGCELVLARRLPSILSELTLMVWIILIIVVDHNIQIFGKDSNHWTQDLHSYAAPYLAGFWIFLITAVYWLPHIWVTATLS